MANMLFLVFHLSFLFYFCWFSFSSSSFCFPVLNERERRRERGETGENNRRLRGKELYRTHIQRSIQDSREDATSIGGR